MVLLMRSMRTTGGIFFLFCISVVNYLHYRLAGPWLVGLVFIDSRELY